MSSSLSTGHVAVICLAVGIAVPLVIMLQRDALPTALGQRPELTVLGAFGCLVVAMANGANDIANSVGTSYGAGALTLRQAILFGSIAEFTGAVSLGSFVAKSIAKGVIDPARFAEEGCDGVLEYGLGMFAVLAGTGESCAPIASTKILAMTRLSHAVSAASSVRAGSTTLLATLYGLPISASHGVIGGLVAVGTYTHGVASLGKAPLIATVVAWVASPLLGGLTSGLIHAIVRSAVHETRSPAAAAHRLQPLLVALTTAVAAAFLIVSGPAVLRISPMWLAIAISCGLGAAAALATLAYRALFAGGDGSASDRSKKYAGRAERGEEGEALKLEARRFAGAAPLPPPGGMVELARRIEGAALSDSDGDTAGAPVATGASAGGEMQHPIEEQPFVPLLVLSALTVAFAHGANDLGNSIGPLAAILVLEQPHGDITATPAIPLWLLLLGAGGFVVGIALLGSRTIQTVGGKITKLTPSRSFAVQMGTAVAVLSSTVLGLAVSTSHCLVGSIIGIGIADRLRGGADAQLNFEMILKIIIGWATTIPLAMLVSVLAFAAMRPSYDVDPVCDAR